MGADHGFLSQSHVSGLNQANAVQQANNQQAQYNVSPTNYDEIVERLKIIALYESGKMTELEKIVYGFADNK